MKKILSYERVYSRWLILLIDQVMVNAGILLSAAMIRNVSPGTRFNLEPFLWLFLYNTITGVVFIRMRIHTGIIRYSNLEDIYRVMKAVLITGLIFGLIYHLFLLSFWTWNWFDTMLLLNFFISTTMLALLRISVKLLFYHLQDMQLPGKEMVLICGADPLALLIKQGLDSSSEKNFHILGFVDDDPDKANKQIEQKRVYPSGALPWLKKQYAADKMIVMEGSSNLEGRKRIIEKCLELGIRVISVPASVHWLKGKLKLSQIPDLKIEDLLQREAILLDKHNICKQLKGKRILITGAAGSIGSEIARQILKCDPEQVLLCDQAETPLHELQMELEKASAWGCCKMFLVNIQNQSRMKNIFEVYKPQVVFHAAALKHVPMMEINPSEALLTNVLGTKNLADLSIESGVEKFIMISTDKAVKPTNVMGASKRIAEIYIQSLQDQEYRAAHGTRFITTRFGNVLGSNGSVVPRFKSQILAGGPVTVTHPDITRYFMTIPEAVQLVLEASAMGTGGEIFIFDMGMPIRIFDLAVNMIKLAGLTPHEDIQITFTGLRPGEKLYEELLNQTELVLPTHHEKIKISAVTNYPYLYVHRMIDDLLHLARSNDDFEMVKKMKEILPDFISNNSTYQQLDIAYQE
ncbi:nucleoside-diphosphate sugar epimerase/dehydratase [Pedobacter sp.]|jgi:FlaA1/EpsC-like NDP-sugar epimerase|uniref:polysaccharide biosynthesis protein n=1 Tax=Pedobacter sp. TaxID=1411316 RepID=UPI002D15299A|nr:nucleoside-diphosphate sugar epimerase/dehydratase [Pedobacter sp.]HWW39032.1 nucleoside-diphosphate sugar epimerase/dehydratase [Pedobacter sp.]